MCDDKAKLAYETYCKSVGGKSWNGDSLPTWEVLLEDPTKAKIVKGWQDVASALTPDLSL